MLQQQAGGPRADRRKAATLFKVKCKEGEFAADEGIFDGVKAFVREVYGGEVTFTVGSYSPDTRIFSPGIFPKKTSRKTGHSEGPPMTVTLRIEPVGKELPDPRHPPSLPTDVEMVSVLSYMMTACTGWQQGVETSTIGLASYVLDHAGAEFRHSAWTVWRTIIDASRKKVSVKWCESNEFLVPVTLQSTATPAAGAAASSGTEGLQSTATAAGTATADGPPAAATAATTQILKDPQSTARGSPAETPCPRQNHGLLQRRSKALALTTTMRGYGSLQSSSKALALTTSTQRQRAGTTSLCQS